MAEFNPQQLRDLKILIRFVSLYCRSRHRSEPTEPAALPPQVQQSLGEDIRLCGECEALVAYAMEKRRKCPLDPKPSCKNCPIHCYSKEYRTRIREVMAFSGKRMILRGRLDLLWHYYF